MTGRLRDAARSIQARVRGFFDAPIGEDADPLELLHAALEDIETNAQPAGRGARVFPYERVIVHVRQPEARRAAIEAVFAQLDARVRARLSAIRCETPGRLPSDGQYRPDESIAEWNSPRSTGTDPAG